MRVNGFVVHGAVTAAVFASGVGAAVAGSTGGGVVLAGPQVLRLIQNSPAALSSYPTLKLTMTFHIQTSGNSVTVHETGLSSPDGKSGTLNVELPDGAGTLSGVVVDSTVYLKASPNAARMLGKSWVGLSITPATHTTPAQTPTGNDALSYLHLLPGATGDVRELGHATIGGVRTTHYRVTVDLFKAEQARPPQLQDGSAGKLQQEGISTLPMDIWLDAQNAPRQVGTSISIQGMRFEYRIGIAGSRTPLHVSAPPASDVRFVSTAAELYQDAMQR